MVSVGRFFRRQRDLIQLKHETLRHVSVRGTSKAEAATFFGVSRPTFYQAEAAFARDGLLGLTPKQRSPKSAHKLSTDVMAFIDQRIEDGGPIHARALADRLETELGISVHPRSIERAIARKKNRGTCCRSRCHSAGTGRCVRGVTHGRDRRQPRPEGAAALRYQGVQHGLPMLIETATTRNPFYWTRTRRAFTAAERRVGAPVDQSRAAHSFGARPCLLTGTRNYG
ncbi:helix-turn-helix domain-containing protein [Paraburkholderia sp. BL23I1N1]|uniref:helix-turn-helix domain-containing protein n=1 Tax=Paraburkholderia sp. BL23I1N1 TaxID=1938802 RepID=UPI0038F70A7B